AEVPQILRCELECESSEDSGRSTRGVLPTALPCCLQANRLTKQNRFPYTPVRGLRTKRKLRLMRSPWRCPAHRGQSTRARRANATARSRTWLCGAGGTHQSVLQAWLQPPDQLRPREKLDSKMQREKPRPRPQPTPDTHKVRARQGRSRMQAIQAPGYCS